MTTYFEKIIKSITPINIAVYERNVEILRKSIGQGSRGHVKTTIFTPYNLQETVNKVPTIEEIFENYKEQGNLSVLHFADKPEMNTLATVIGSEEQKNPLGLVFWTKSAPRTIHVYANHLNDQCYDHVLKAFPSRRTSNSLGKLAEKIMGGKEVSFNIHN